MATVDAPHDGHGQDAGQGQRDDGHKDHGDESPHPTDWR